MGNERKLSVAESWRLALVDPTHRGEGAVGTGFAEIQSLAGRPVETRTCDRPEPADLGEPGGARQGLERGGVRGER